LEKLRGGTGVPGAIEQSFTHSFFSHSKPCMQKQNSAAQCVAEVARPKSGKVVIAKRPVPLSAYSVDIVSYSSSGFSVDLAAVLWPLWLTGSSLWLHLATVISLALGLVLTLRRETPRALGVERMIPFGPTFFAAPLALFGLQHFVFLNEVKDVVPSWMPGHIFWACLVGVALIAASLSMMTEIKAGLAALLTGIMLFLFVLMIDLPGLVQDPHDRFGITGTLRDLALSGGALALAGTVGVLGTKQPMSWLVNVGRWFFAAPMLYFGAEHFLHPEFAPGVPFPVMMPSWIPGHLAWAYGTGAVLVVGGVCILANKGARTAAAWLGIAFLLLVVCIYMPREIIHPSIEISGELDDVTDTLAMSGAALLVAGAIARKTVLGAESS